MFEWITTPLGLFIASTTTASAVGSFKWATKIDAKIKLHDQLMLDLQNSANRLEKKVDTVDAKIDDVKDYLLKDRK